MPPPDDAAGRPDAPGRPRPGPAAGVTGVPRPARAGRVRLRSSDVGLRPTGVRLRTPHVGPGRPAGGRERPAELADGRPNPARRRGATGPAPGTASSASGSTTRGARPGASWPGSRSPTTSTRATSTPAPASS